MQGYINDPSSTTAVMDSDGYFNTGDLVRLNPATGKYTLCLIIAHKVVCNLCVCTIFLRIL